MHAAGLLEMLMVFISVGQEVMWAELQNFALFENAQYMPDLLITVQTFVVTLFISPIFTRTPRVALILLDTIVEIILMGIYVIAIRDQNDPLWLVKVCILGGLELIECILFWVSLKLSDKEDQAIIHTIGDAAKAVNRTKHSQSLFAFSLLVFGAGFLYGFMPNFCTINAFGIGSVDWSRYVVGAIGLSLLPISIRAGGANLSAWLMFFLGVGMSVMFTLNILFLRPVPVIPLQWSSPSGPAPNVPPEILSQFTIDVRLNEIAPQALSGASSITVPLFCNEFHSINDTIPWQVCGDTLAVTPNDVLYCYTYSVLAAACVVIIPLLGLLFAVLLILLGCCGCAVASVGQACTEFQKTMLQGE